MKCPHECRFVVSFVVTHRHFWWFCVTQTASTIKEPSLTFCSMGMQQDPNQQIPPTPSLPPPLPSLPSVLIPTFSAHLSKPPICKEKECSVEREGVDNAQWGPNLCQGAVMRTTILPVGVTQWTSVEKVNSVGGWRGKPKWGWIRKQKGGMESALGWEQD